MSAVNIMRGTEEILLWTDAASYLADGTVGSFGGKVIPLPHLNCAMAARAPRLFGPLIADHLGGTFETFDALVEGFAAEVQAATIVHASLFRLCTLGADFELYVAGWSESRQRPESYILTNTTRHEGLPAWTLSELQPLSIAPWDEDLAGRVEAEFAGGVTGNDPVDVGMRLIELQRTVKAVPVEGYGEMHGVGGFCQLTVIKPHGITMQVLRWWPEDRLGEKLGMALAA